MRVNGINSYANVQAFRGTEAATGEEKAEKKLNKKAVAGIAAGTIGAAAVGVSLLAYTKGRKLNGADGKIFQNVADGFKEIGKSIAKIFKKGKAATEAVATTPALPAPKEAVKKPVKDVAENTMVNLKEVGYRDKELSERFGKNMSVVGYFHSL